MNEKHTTIEQLMEELDGGNLGPRMALALADAAMAVSVVNEKKKRAKVIVEFDIGLIGGDGNQVQIDHTIKTRSPTHRGKKAEEHTTSSVMFVHGRGILTALNNSNRQLQFGQTDETRQEH